MVFVPRLHMRLGTKNYFTKYFNLEKLTPTQKLILGRCRIFHHQLDRGHRTGIRRLREVFYGRALYSNEMIALFDVMLAIFKLMSGF